MIFPTVLSERCIIYFHLIQLLTPTFELDSV